MKFQPDRQSLILGVFILLSLISAAYIIEASLNYVRLFPAISQLSDGVSSVLFRNDLTARVFVSNPVEYTGLIVLRGSLGVFFISGTDALFENSTITDSSSFNIPIAPHTNTTWDWTIKLSTGQASSLSSFYVAHARNVTTHCLLALDIGTFLVGQFGTTPFLGQDNVTLAE